MRIADLTERVSFQKLEKEPSFYGDKVVPTESFDQWANIKDKGVTETDSNGHVHEARELLVTVRSCQKTRSIAPDIYLMKYRESFYDITHIEVDSRYRRWITLHARRKTHGS